MVPRGGRSRHANPERWKLTMEFLGGMLTAKNSRRSTLELFWSRPYRPAGSTY